MLEFKKILACVDLSCFSETVLDYAAEIAGKEGAEIIVYNVIHQRDIDHVEETSTHYVLYSAGSPGQNITTDQYIEKETERRSVQLKNLIEKHLAPVNVKSRIQIDTGYPCKSILNTAHNEKADLIVMGNKGRGHLADTVIGSTALRVLRRADIPVLSVR